MTETDLKDAILSKLREGSHNYRLSPGFCGRLRASVRRMRRRWLMKVSAAVLAAVIVCLVMSTKLILIVAISAAVVFAMFILGKMADGKDEGVSK